MEMKSYISGVEPLYMLELKALHPSRCVQPLMLVALTVHDDTSSYRGRRAMRISRVGSGEGRI
jgi:hypothetical protein